MPIKRSKDYSYLDSVRINEGIDICKDVFAKACKESGRRSAILLNDRQLTFPCLFVLLPQIEFFHLYQHLNSRNLIVLGIINQVLKPHDFDDGIDYLSLKKKTVYSVLKWILETGNVEDSLNNEYEEILDITVSVLINTYKDKSILPVVADMIFKRNRKGRYIHDLVWAFFRIHDSNSLKLIAEYILSSEKKDVDLACNLLNIEETNKNNITANGQKQYQSFLRWLEENNPFLCFTGECFQFASKPTFCRVDLERKYMYKGITSYNGRPIAPLDDSENKCLQAFQSLSNEEKMILSEFSYRIRKKNVSEWKKWMGLPIGEQITSAKSGLEGSQ